VVSLAKITGGNKEYVEKVILGISQLLRPSINKVINASEVLIIPKDDREIEHIPN